jgi:exopolysaccharide biosynthesis polyprenyl glycosylphosphotransferase
MLKRHHELVRAALVIGDALGTATALIAAFWIRFYSGWIPSPKGIPASGPYLQALPLMVLACIVAYRYTGLYQPRRTSSFVSEVLDIVKATVAAVIAVVATSFFLRSDVESRAVVALFAGLNPFSMSLFRGAIRTAVWRARRKGYNRRYAIIVGTGKLGQRVAEKIQRNPWTGFEIRGFVEAQERKRERHAVHGVPIIGRAEDLPRLIREKAPDQVFVALPFEQARTIRRVTDILEREAIAVTLVPDIFEFVTMRASAADFDGLPIINLRDRPIDELGLIAKRALDVAVALAGLVLVSPILIGIALAVWTTSGRPIFYSQERMGLDGRRFMMLKFRTMRTDAEVSTGAVWAKENDPRVTRLGRWLRRLSLDELPQLWNVLRGDMSIVGPRPERPVLIEDFKRKIPRYMLRHAIKAGITGWAQVNGWRGDTSLKKRLQYDLYYIENWSLLFDLKIMLLTFVRGFYHPNAY